MAYERILVAVDLSDEAEEVIAAAQQQAENNDNSELHHRSHHKASGSHAWRTGYRRRFQFPLISIIYCSSVLRKLSAPGQTTLD